jgi:hypothetical protein
MARPDESGTIAGRAAESRSPAMATYQSRARRLLNAVVGVASDLSLPGVLLPTARSSRDLVDADYGALDVLFDHQLTECSMLAWPAMSGRTIELSSTFPNVPVWPYGTRFANLQLSRKHGRGWPTDGTTWVDAHTSASTLANADSVVACPFRAVVRPAENGIVHTWCDWGDPGDGRGYEF